MCPEGFPQDIAVVDSKNAEVPFRTISQYIPKLQEKSSEEDLCKSFNKVINKIDSLFEFGEKKVNEQNHITKAFAKGKCVNFLLRESITKENICSSEILAYYEKENSKLVVLVSIPGDNSHFYNPESLEISVYNELIDFNNKNNTYHVVSNIMPEKFEGESILARRCGIQVLEDLYGAHTISKEEFFKSK